MEKARRGEFIPWAYHCYGYLPKRPGCPPQVVIEPAAAEVVRRIYRALVEEQRTCRQITIRSPCIQNRDTFRPKPGLAAGDGQEHPEQSGLRWTGPLQLSPARRAEISQDRGKWIALPQTGRSYRPDTEWVRSEAPAIISVELFEKAQLQLRRNAEAARKMYHPASHRYLLRTLVKCGECGLGMVCIRQRSLCKKYEYLYYECKGHQPLTCGRLTKCPSRRVRAERLDAGVWRSLCQLLRTPR